MNKLFHLFISGFAFCASLFYSIYLGFSSIVVIWALFFCLGIFTFRNNTIAIKTFLIPYSIYSIYMFITTFIYVDVPGEQFFAMVDSMQFWKNSNFFIYDFEGVLDSYKGISLRTVRYRFFNFISIFLAFLAQIFDQNNIVIQKLQCVFFGSMSVPFIYKLFLFYFEKNKAYRYTLAFSLLSPLFFYSSIFNRDVHVFFLYTLGFYTLVYHKKNRFSLLNLVVLMVLLAGFRFEHSLFFVVFIFSYYYLKAKKNKSLLIVMIVLIPVLLATTFSFIMTKYTDNQEVYSERIRTRDRKSLSAGAVFVNLPHGMKQIAMAANGQLAVAVPFWRNFSLNKRQVKYKQDGYFNLWRFPDGIAGLLWIYVWAILIYGWRLKLFKTIPKELKLLLLISILLLIATSSAANPRRYFCVYPAMYLVAMYLLNFFTRNQKKKVLKNTTLFLVVLHVAYISVKGF